MFAEVQQMPCGASVNELIPECSGIARVTACTLRAMDDEWKSISY